MSGTVKIIRYYQPKIKFRNDIVPKFQETKAKSKEIFIIKAIKIERVYYLMIKRVFYFRNFVSKNRMIYLNPLNK